MIKTKNETNKNSLNLLKVLEYNYETNNKVILEVLDKDIGSTIDTALNLAQKMQVTKVCNIQVLNNGYVQIIIE